MPKPKVKPSEAHVVKPVLETNRKCRDVIFLIIFGVFWVGMIIVAVNAVRQGNPRRLVVPVDYLGNFCGYDNVNATNIYKNQTSKPYLYADLVLDKGVFTCIESCPNVTRVLTPTDYVCAYNITNPTTTDYAKYVSKGFCASVAYQSDPVLNRCIPTAGVTSLNITTTNTTSNSALSILSTSSDFGTRVVADLTKSWPLLVVGALVAIVLTMLWMFILQWFAGIFVWLSVLVANLAFIAGAVWLYFYWQLKQAFLNDTKYSLSGTPWFDKVVDLTGLNQGYISEYQVQLIMYAFYVVAVLAGLMLLITLAMIKRIRIAIAVIRQASNAMMKMKLIVIFPIGILIFVLFNITYFLVILAYLVTPDGPQALTVEFASQVWNDPNVSKYMIGYHVFGFLWTFFFLSGINQMTISGAIANWYFTYDKSQSLHFPVMKSLYRVIRYHLGSVAVGSLLIAIVEFIRLLLYNAQRQAQKSGNQQLQYLVACLQCCFKIVSMIVKFINKNAYIYISISGDAFFHAAGEATNLIVRNALRAVAIDFVSDFILLLSKLVITALSALGSFYYLETYGVQQFGKLNSNFTPAVAVALEAFVIASAFFSVYQMAIDTIFLCFLYDLDTNDGTSSRPYYMTDGMRRILGVENKKGDGAITTKKQGKKVAPVEVDEF